MQKKILLIEDENAIRELVELTLRTEGYEVVSAEDGRQASQCLGEGLPDQGGTGYP